MRSRHRRRSPGWSTVIRIYGSWIAAALLLRALGSGAAFDMAALFGLICCAFLLSALCIGLLLQVRDLPQRTLCRLTLALTLFLSGAGLYAQHGPASDQGLNVGFAWAGCFIVAVLAAVAPSR